MHGLIREEYAFPASAKVLARHMYSRMHSGRVVIIADSPKIFLSLLRKQWLKLTLKVQVQRSSTLQGQRVKELTTIIAKMQTMRFKAEWGSDPIGADVYIATAGQLLQWPPECGTMYVTCDISSEQLHMVTAWMRKGSLVVVYLPTTSS